MIISFQSYSASAVLDTSTRGQKSNASATGPLALPAASLAAGDRERLLAIRDRGVEGSTFLLYRPVEPRRAVDLSIVLIFLMATFSVGAGSLWSGYTKHHL